MLEQRHLRFCEALVENPHIDLDETLEHYLRIFGIIKDKVGARLQTFFLEVNQASLGWFGDGAIPLWFRAFIDSSEWPPLPTDLNALFQKILEEPINRILRRIQQNDIFESTHNTIEIKLEGFQWDLLWHYFSEDETLIKLYQSKQPDQRMEPDAPFQKLHRDIWKHFGEFGELTNQVMSQISSKMLQVSVGDVRGFLAQIGDKVFQSEANSKIGFLNEDRELDVELIYKTLAALGLRSPIASLSAEVALDPLADAPGVDSLRMI